MEFDAAPTLLDEQPTEKPDIIAQVEADPSLILTGKIAVTDYEKALRAGLSAEPLDVTTATGRQRRVSEAHKITKKKTAIDNRRKQMTEEWRTKTAAVNAVGKAAVEALATLAEEIRAPVTAWEDRQKELFEEANRIIGWLETSKTVAIDETADDVQQRLDAVRGFNLNDEVLGDRIELATQFRDAAVAALTAAIADIRQREAMAAELEQLRREKEEAARRAEAQEAERLAKERAEAATKAEAERIEKMKAEAAEQARRDAEEAAERKRQEEAAAARAAEQERARKAQAEIDAANARAAEAERKAEAERRAIAEQKRQAEEKAAAEAAELARRQQDKAHKRNVMTEAKEAIMTCGADEEVARKIVLSIIAGEVPRVSIQF
jgi:colicin import membrane protein